MPLRSHRKRAVGTDSTVLSIVRSKRIAARTCSLVNEGLVMILVRIRCTRSNICSSVLHALSSMP